MSTDIADRSERHALGHARAFYKALKQLRELQAARQSPNGCGESLPLPFTNQADCESFLADRFKRGERP